MTNRSALIAFGVSSVIGGVLGITAGAARTLVPTSAVVIPPAPEAHSDLLSSARFDELIDRTRRDPFRAELTADPPEIEMAQASEPPIEANPAPSIVGVIGGPPWSALLRSIVSPAAVVIQQGDTVDGLHVLLVSIDSVVVDDGARLWTLRVQEER